MSNQPPKMPLDIVSMTGISGNNPSNGTHFMTMKEYDAKLNELKRENFQLKLTIYLAEKEKTGVTKPGFLLYLIYLFNSINYFYFRM